MKNLKDRFRNLLSRFFENPIKPAKASDYSLSKTFCSNCAGSFPIIFPVYLAKDGGKFFKVIDRQSVQVITCKAGLIAIANHYESKETALFQHVIDGTIYDKGYRKITETEYHMEFSLASQDTTLMHTLNLHKAE